MSPIAMQNQTNRLAQSGLEPIAICGMCTFSFPTQMSLNYG